MKTIFFAAVAVAALAACSPKADRLTREPAPKTAPSVVNTAGAGSYIMDRAHTSVNFRVSHIGMSHYTARFTKMDGTLQFDPAKPEASVLKVTIDPASIQTNYPLPDVDFDAELRSKDLLATDQFPTMAFNSTAVVKTGANTAKVTGDLNFRGVTKPVVLDVTFNGGMAPNSMDPAGSRIGFSAHGSLKRSEFGMGYGLPPAGSTMGVSDEVEILIETEFTKK